jgi:hypothetical protein
MEYISDEENIDVDFFQVNNEIKELCQTLNVDTQKYYYNCNLEQHLSSFLENDFENLKIHICAYNINTTNKYPYLQYFLYKNNQSDFEFPSFIYKDEQDLITKSLKVIQILCKSFYKDTCFEFKGFIHEDDNNIFMFFDCSHMVVDTLRMTEINDLWLVTMDEILNHQHVCGFKINEYISSFFHKNTDLCYLTNKQGIHYSIPKIVYSKCETRQISFISTFGIPIKTDIFGNYYYFTDYDSAIKTNNGFGLIRCLLFLGKTKIVTNLENDTSDISKQLLKNNLDDTYLSDNYIQTKMMMKVTDWDSHWTLNYDSLFIGKVILDDGSIFDRGPMWVVQNYEQYCVLSSQEIKKKKINKEENK